jgi:pimeloyl-ACP methyl ester carboxylesterase
MRTFARDGYVFDVRDEGPQDGTVVVLLHGFPQDSTAWDGIVGPLHAAGYRTLAPDQRGYSVGAMPAAPKAYKQAELVNDVMALLDAAETKKVHIVGHDWGGSVAWSFASEHPERCLSMTSLSTPNPAAFKAVAFRSTQLLKSWYMGMFQIPKLSESVLRPGGSAWRAMSRGLPEHQARHYEENMTRPGALTAALNWYRALPKDMAHPSIQPQRITVPVLYIWGERDPALGRAAAEATADFVTGDYTFVALADVGHWIPETSPEIVGDEMLAFFNRLDS